MGDGDHATVLDDDQDGCHGRDLLHEGDPNVCVDWWGAGNYCGVH